MDILPILNLPIILTKKYKEIVIKNFTEAGYTIINKDNYIYIQIIAQKKYNIFIYTYEEIDYNISNRLLDIYDESELTIKKFIYFISNFVTLSCCTIQKPTNVSESCFLSHVYNYIYCNYNNIISPSPNSIESNDKNTLFVSSILFKNNDKIDINTALDNCYNYLSKIIPQKLKTTYTEKHEKYLINMLSSDKDKYNILPSYISKDEIIKILNKYAISYVYTFNIDTGAENIYI